MIYSLLLLLCSTMLGSLSVISTTVLALYATLLQTAESATVSPFMPALLKNAIQWKSADSNCDDTGTSWAPILILGFAAFLMQGEIRLEYGSFLSIQDNGLAALLFNVFIFVYPCATAWIIMSIAWEQMMRREVYYIMLHYKVRRPVGVHVRSYPCDACACDNGLIAYIYLP